MIQTFYENQVKEERQILDKRTVAFQVPGELFDDLHHGCRRDQNAFFLAVLAEAQRNVRCRDATRHRSRRDAPPGGGHPGEEGPTETSVEESQKDKLQEGILRAGVPSCFGGVFVFIYPDNRSTLWLWQ